MDDVSCRGGLSKQVPREEHDDRPSQNPCQQAQLCLILDLPCTLPCPVPGLTPHLDVSQRIFGGQLTARASVRTINVMAWPLRRRLGPTFSAVPTASTFGTGACGGSNTFSSNSMMRTPTSMQNGRPSSKEATRMSLRPRQVRATSTT